MKQKYALLVAVLVVLSGAGFYFLNEEVTTGDKAEADTLMRGKHHGHHSQISSKAKRINKHYVNRGSNNSAEIVEPIIPAAEDVLSEAEIAGLVLMREEEKLARDVYTVLGEKWGTRIFFNIARSEQNHVNAVGNLLVDYGIPDPIKDDSVGVFTDGEIQALYNELVARGLTSREEAFQVGATIEDLDIYDLEELMSETNRADILRVYENLQNGSRNHMRAFTRQINRSGDIYVPQYISQSEYDAIIGLN